MNSRKYRELQEALKRLNSEGASVAKHATDDGLGIALHLVMKAAREVLDRWQLCGECKGSGRLGFDTDYLGNGWTCAVCHGSGVLHNPEGFMVALHSFDGGLWQFHPTDEVDDDPEATHIVYPIEAVRAFDKDPE